MFENIISIIIALVVVVFIGVIGLILKYNNETSMNDNHFKPDLTILNDDVCEQIFQRRDLTVKDLFRLERVSNQFKRLLFRNEKIICFYEEISDMNLLEAYIKRSPNIKDITLYRNRTNDISSQTQLFNESVFNLIIKYCLSVESIDLSLMNVTEEVITKFGQTFGHKLKSIDFQIIVSLTSTLNKEQELLKLCPNLKKIRIHNNSFLDDIENQPIFSKLEKLCLEGCKLWSMREVSKFRRMVDKYEHRLKYLGVCAEFGENDRFCDVIQQISRLSNLKVLEIEISSPWFYNMPTFPIQLNSLAINCKNLKKIKIWFDLDDFDLWQTFNGFNELKEFAIRNAWLIINSVSDIKPLINLKRIHIRCKAIDDLFFLEIAEFAPNLQKLYLISRKPRYQLSNQSLIALSECSQLKVLVIRLKHENNEDNEDIDYPLIDDIGFNYLINNCRNLRIISLECKMTSIVMDFIKWFEADDKRQKQNISLKTYLSKEFFDTNLKDVTRIPNVKKLELKVLTVLVNEINIENRGFISVSIGFGSLNAYFTDLCLLLSHFEALEILILDDNHIEWLTDSERNVEPLLDLKFMSLKVEYLTIHKTFFEIITRLAPNLEIFEMTSQLKNFNNNLKYLSQLKRLTKISILQFRPEFSSDSIDNENEWILHLLDNCHELNEIVFDFVVNICHQMIDRLKESANQRPNEILLFRCYVKLEESKTNNLPVLPKNLFIRTIFLKNK